jgi:hypothetical protein
MSNVEVSESIEARQIRIIRLLTAFMIIVAILLLAIGGLALFRFGRSPHTEAELSSYSTSVVRSAAITGANSDRLAEQLQEVILYYLSALRCVLWGLVGSGFCLLSTVYCAHWLNGKLRGRPLK